MPAKLFCRTGEFAGSEHHIGQEATIGRAPDNTIVIPGLVVSEKHARLLLDDRSNRYVLEDLQSRNGTSVDGVPVTGRTRLGDLHVVTFAGVHDFFFQILEGADGNRIENAARPSDTGLTAPASPGATVSPKTTWQPLGPIELPSELQQRLSGPPPSSPPTTFQEGGPLAVPSVLQHMPSTAEPGASPPAGDISVAPEPSLSLEIAVREQSEVRTVLLTQGVQRIGRADSCEIHILEPTLSREHAMLTVRGSLVTIADLDSRNGTFIGGVRIASATEIQPGVAVELGDAVVLKLVREGGTKTEPV